MVTITFPDVRLRSVPLAFLLGGFRSGSPLRRALVPRPRWKPSLPEYALPSREKQPMSSKWRRFEVLLESSSRWARCSGQWLAEAVWKSWITLARPVTRRRRLKGTGVCGVLYRDNLVRIVLICRLD